MRLSAQDERHQSTVAFVAKISEDIEEYSYALWPLREDLLIARINSRFFVLPDCSSRARARRAAGLRTCRGCVLPRVNGGCVCPGLTSRENRCKHSTRKAIPTIIPKLNT